MSKCTGIRRACTLVGLGVAWAAGGPAARADEPLVSIVSEANPGPAAAHGLDKLAAALGVKKVPHERTASLNTARGKVLIVAGVAGRDETTTRLLKQSGRAVPQGPEALVIRRTDREGTPVWVLAGSDAGGLLYAALDV